MSNYLSAGLPESKKAAVRTTKVVQNNAGGRGYATLDMPQLDRFLMLGTLGGTYYVAQSDLTKQNIDVIKKLASDSVTGLAMVARIVEISEAGRAPKNDPAICALAVAYGEGTPEVRKAALDVLSRVCRTGTHLFQFMEFASSYSGWGRGVRNALANWYTDKTSEALAYQVLKYANRNGWTHRDVLRIAHPKASDTLHNAVFGYAVKGTLPLLEGEVETNPLRQLYATDMLKSIGNGSVVASDAESLVIDAITRYDLPREVVPTQYLNSPRVWEALLERMPLTAMIRNLGKMSAVGLLTNNSNAARKVVDALSADRLHKARVHPINILIAQETYAMGKGLRGSNTWIPVGSVTRALEGAFYDAFANVEPSGKRFCVSVDVSGSMGWCGVLGIPSLTPAKLSAAMALVLLNSEPYVDLYAFSDKLVNLPIKASDSLASAMRKGSMAFGGTDCGLPVQDAIQHARLYDVFVNLTDNEHWARFATPGELMRKYRSRYNKYAKMINIGMVANQFTVGDPNDMLNIDIAGFDAAIPQLVTEFARL